MLSIVDLSLWNCLPGRARKYMDDGACALEIVNPGRSCVWLLRWPQGLGAVLVNGIVV